MPTPKTKPDYDGALALLDGLLNLCHVASIGLKAIEQRETAEAERRWNNAGHESTVDGAAPQLDQKSKALLAELAGRPRDIGPCIALESSKSRPELIDLHRRGLVELFASDRVTYRPELAEAFDISMYGRVAHVRIAGADLALEPRKLALLRQLCLGGLITITPARRKNARWLQTANVLVHERLADFMLHLPPVNGTRLAEEMPATSTSGRIASELRVTSLGRRVFGAALGKSGQKSSGATPRVSKKKPKRMGKPGQKKARLA